MDIDIFILYVQIFVASVGKNFLNLLTRIQTIEVSSAFETWTFKVINVGGDTFGNPIFQKGLQN